MFKPGTDKEVIYSYWRNVDVAHAHASLSEMVQKSQLSDIDLFLESGCLDLIDLDEDPAGASSSYFKDRMSSFGGNDHLWPLDAALKTLWFYKNTTEDFQYKGVEMTRFGFESVCTQQHHERMLELCRKTLGMFKQAPQKAACEAFTMVQTMGFGTCNRDYLLLADQFADQYLNDHDVKLKSGTIGLPEFIQDLGFSGKPYFQPQELGLFLWDEKMPDILNSDQEFSLLCDEYSGKLLRLPVWTPSLDIFEKSLLKIQDQCKKYGQSDEFYDSVLDGAVKKNKFYLLPAMRLLKFQPSHYEKHANKIKEMGITSYFPRCANINLKKLDCFETKHKRAFMCQDNDCLSILNSTSMSQEMKDEFLLDVLKTLRESSLEIHEKVSNSKIFGQTNIKNTAMTFFQAVLKQGLVKSYQHLMQNSDALQYVANDLKLVNIPEGSKAQITALLAKTAAEQAALDIRKELRLQ